MKVCLTTFVYGEAYQAYIPFLMYSCYKAYPEYDMVIFVYKSLAKNIKKQIEKLNYSNVTIIENSFSDCPQMTPRISQCLRWVLWDLSFLQYDYLYIVDIDMLYVREPKPLHEQHIEHMRITGLCFDNMRRIHKRNPFKLSSIGQRIKYAGTKAILKYLFGSRIEYRATGLHFIKVSEYYSAIPQDHLSSIRKQIYSGDWLNRVMYPNDEVFLYKILENHNLHPEKMAIQSNSCKSLDFNSYLTPEFRPHHGIHIGIFRNPVPLEERISDLKILQSDAYIYYKTIVINSYFADKEFLSILSLAPESIKNSYNRLLEYYK